MTTTPKTISRTYRNPASLAESGRIYADQDAAVKFAAARQNRLVAVN